MRNITILSILLILISFSSFSQIAILEINNPFPRVGDECEFTYKIKKDTMDVSESKPLMEQMKEIRDKDLGSGTFKFTKFISDTGLNTFGPFIFNVNNRTVRSSIINLQFDKPLPNEKSGIWVRQRSYQGDEYIIIEQRISGEWITTNTSENSSSTEFKKDSDDFIEIDKEHIVNDKIEFAFSYSATKSQEVEINNKSETVSYKISLYRIKRNGAFNDKFTLDKNNLKFLPKNRNDFEFTVR